jgi:hypothetical protein
MGPKIMFGGKTVVTLTFKMRWRLWGLTVLSVRMWWCLLPTFQTHYSRPFSGHSSGCRMDDYNMSETLARNIIISVATTRSNPKVLWQRPWKPAFFIDLYFVHFTLGTLIRDSIYRKTMPLLSLHSTLGIKWKF